MSEDEQLRKKAKERAELKIGFYWHLPIYVIVNIMLFLIWFYTGQGFPWFIFPLIFWGIGLVAHGLNAFVSKGSFTERMAEKEYEKMKKDRR